MSLLPQIFHMCSRIPLLVKTASSEVINFLWRLTHAGSQNRSRSTIDRTVLTGGGLAHFFSCFKRRMFVEITKCKKTVIHD